MAESKKDVVISVKGLKKLYRIGLEEQKHDSISSALMSWIKSPLKNFKKLRSLSSIKNENDEDVLIALNDINFELRKGEVLGVVGKNGAGKSTLLKVLSRITQPSDGEIQIEGRVASLLEVGTGFHPELTGRENIYLNGTILGMTRKEIDSKLDEIIDFSGVERFVDTPVKRYSSGMKVRLAFAVAAHLDPEILIVDEVLAVGDVEFQQKCIGKMGEVSGSGKTVLFVSHNMGAVAELCTRAILLEKGKLTYTGTTEEVIQRYMEGNNVSGLGVDPEVIKDTCSQLLINNIKMHDEDQAEKYQFDIHENVYLSYSYTLNEGLNSFDNAIIINRNGVDVMNSFDTDFVHFEERSTGVYNCVYKIPKFFLKEGNYTLSMRFRNTLDGSHYLNHDSLIRFEMQSLQISTANKGYWGKRVGSVIFPGDWEIKKA